MQGVIFGKTQSFHSEKFIRAKTELVRFGIKCTFQKLKNFKKAEANYEKALELDPENKIALEYQGELFVETERLGLAQVNLNKLKELCPTSCDELEQLRKYINQEAEKSL